ncbi:MAG: shikimate dehydrogenase family protein [Caldicoprobacterales bacterium]|jgi:shikimate dehydrogenase|nr:shikimate dehydrogenase [Clostridiales bacterium]
MFTMEKAARPTIYFIGVTTAKSSIMKVFPLWAKEVGLDDAVIKGIDIEIHAAPEVYREVVRFIKNDPLSMGALVTTHKIDLYNAAKELFDYLDPYARMFGELSSISKKGGRLEGHAKDPISSGLAMEGFIPEGFWEEYGGEVFIMGAGGSAIAISSYLLNKNKGNNIPSRIVISNRSTPRLKEIERIIKTVNPDVPAEFHHAPVPEVNDRILDTISEHSLIVNATGLGKDRPGSPLTDACNFPKNSLVWEINYRGDLRFMHQAIEQKQEKNLHVEDGWIYFIHGWTQVIAEVFSIDITGDAFNKFNRIANEIRLMP